MSLFACIYFKEDSSLSVVNKNDKNLILDTTFDTKTEVTMTWRKGAKKELYHGTIIKIGDNEDALLRFAKAANKKVLSQSAIKETDNNVLNELFSFKEKGNVGGKRQRVQTEISKLSAAQDAEFSPKKSKIKNVAVTRGENHQTTPAGNNQPAGDKEINMEKAEVIASAQKVTSTKKRGTIKVVDGTALDIGKQMFQQFYNEKDQEGTPAATPAAPHPEIRSKEASDNMSTSKSKTNSQQFNISTVDPETANTTDPSSTPQKTPPQKTPPQKTPELSTTKTTTQHDSLTRCSVFIARPCTQSTGLASTEVAPSAMNTDEAAIHSNIGYVRAGSMTDISNPVSEKLTPLTQTWRTCKEAIDVVRSRNHCQIPMPSSEILQTLQAVCKPEFLGFVNSIVEHLQNNNCNHTCFQQLIQQPQTTQNTSYMDLSDTHFEEQSYDENTSFTSQMSMASNFPEASTPNFTSTRKPSHPSVTPVRRSPRKHVQRAIENNFPSSKSVSQTLNEANTSEVRDSRKSSSSDDSEMVYLLADENRTTRVNRSAKNKAISAAKLKQGKEGYVLMYRMVGEVFSVLELAQSVGTGASKNKATDTQPILDQEKLRDLKDFVTMFCKSNKFVVPTDPVFNKAINERIGYARKQLKNDASRCGRELASSSKSDNLMETESITGASFRARADASDERR